MKTLLEEAVVGYPEGRDRSQVLWRLGRLAMLGRLMSLEAADGLLDQAEREAGGDLRLRSQIQRMRFWVPSQRYQYSAADEHARAALELARLAGDPAARAASLAMVAWAEMACGRGVAADAIAEALETWEAAARTPSGSTLALDEHPGYLCGQALHGADRLDEARLALEAMRRDASERGSDTTLFYALGWLSGVEVLAGDWVLASRYAEEASRLEVDTDVGGAHQGRHRRSLRASGGGPARACAQSRAPGAERLVRSDRRGPRLPGLPRPLPREPRRGASSSLADRRRR